MESYSSSLLHEDRPSVLDKPTKELIGFLPKDAERYLFQFDKRTKYFPKPVQISKNKKLVYECKVGVNEDHNEIFTCEHCDARSYCTKPILPCNYFQLRIEDNYNDFETNDYKDH